MALNSQRKDLLPRLSRNKFSKGVDGDSCKAALLNLLFSSCIATISCVEDFPPIFSPCPVPREAAPALKKDAICVEWSYKERCLDKKRSPF